MMLLGLLQSLGIMFAVILPWGVLKGAFPPRPRPDDPSPEELARIFRSQRAKGFLVAVLSLVVAALSVRQAFLRLAQAFAPAAEPESLLFKPSGAYWLLVGLVIGLAVAFLIGPLYHRWTLGDRFSLFMRGEDRDVGFRVVPVLSILSLVFIVGAGTFAALGLDYYVAVTPTGFTFQPLWGFRAQKHSCQEVRRIVTAGVFEDPLGMRRAQPHYVIEFSDGTRWSSSQYPMGVAMRERCRLFGYVARHGGVAIERVPLLTRDEVFP